MRGVESAIRAALAPLHRRVMMMIARGLISLVDDTGTRQTVQVKLLADETLSDVERFQEYGVTSNPPVGSEAIFASIVGARAQGVVICVENRRYRLTGLASGEIALHDDQGQKIHLMRNGILVSSPFKVQIVSAVEADVNAPKVVVTADECDLNCPNIQLGGEGGQPVARVGDTVAGGLITSGSAKVSAA